MSHVAPGGDRWLHLGVKSVARSFNVGRLGFTTFNNQRLLWSGGQRTKTTAASTAGAELKEVEQHHEREEDGGPGDVDETSDGGDRDTIPLTLHGGEDEKLHVTVRTLHHIGH